MTQRPGLATVSRRLGQRGHDGIRYVATGAQTGHDFGLFEYELAAHTDGASPHLHTTFSESFYLLDGRLDVLDGEDWITVGPGDLVHVPASSVHGFRNTGPEVARFLVLFVPGSVPREEYFDAVRERRRLGIVLDDAAADEFAARFDQYNVR